MTADPFDPFFITGCPRSGTTLLQVMLNRHPDIAIPPELKLFFLYHRMPRTIRRATLRRIEADLKMDSRIPEDLTTREVYKAVAAAWSGKRYFGDKTPEYAYRLRWVNEVFPNSRLVLMVRDPRDVAYSLSKVPWLRCNPIGAAALWRRTQSRMRSDCLRLSNPVLWVTYESLVLQPAATLARILEFIGVSTEPTVIETMLTPTSTDMIAIPERELSWKSSALTSANEASLFRWRLRDEAEVTQVESICYEQMIEAGYMPQFPPPRFRARHQLRAACGLMTIAMRLPIHCWVSEISYGIIPRILGAS